MSDKVVMLDNWRAEAVIDGGLVTSSTDAAEVGKVKFFVAVTKGTLTGLSWDGETLAAARAAAQELVGKGGRIIDRCADGS